MDITRLYQTQISLTEWLEKVGHEKSAAIRLEDNEKRKRLQVLNEIIGLPYDKPYEFPATDIVEEGSAFRSFLNEYGDELCALRLIPLDSSLPKLRMRGMKICESLLWFRDQKIEPVKYRAEFVPHSEKIRWSTIFVVNPSGIYGEIIASGDHYLTQGFYENVTPISFSFDWNEWRLSESNLEAEAHLKEIAQKLYVENSELQNILVKKLGARFERNYLLGYFETVTSEEFGLWFIDYNRILGEMYADFVTVSGAKDVKDNRILIGQSASEE